MFSAQSGSCPHFKMLFSIFFYSFVVLNSLWFCFLSSEVQVKEECQALLGLWSHPFSVFVCSKARDSQLTRKTKPVTDGRAVASFRRAAVISRTSMRSSKRTPDISSLTTQHRAMCCWTGFQDKWHHLWLQTFSHSKISFSNLITDFSLSGKANSNSMPQ